MAHYPDYKLEDFEMQEGQLDLTPVIESAPTDLTKSQRQTAAKIIRYQLRTSDLYEVKDVRWSDGYRGRFYLSFQVIIKDAWYEADPKKYKMGALFYDRFHYRLGIRGKLETMDGKNERWVTNSPYLRSNSR